MTAGTASPVPAGDTFTFARDDTLREIHHDLTGIMYSLVARPWPLRFWRTMLAVWLGVTLAGITLAALAFLAVATFASAAVDDAAGDITTSDTDAGTFDIPSDFPSDVPSDIGEETP